MTGRVGRPSGRFFNQRVLIDGVVDPGKDRPAIALVPNRPGKVLWREFLGSAGHRFGEKSIPFAGRFRGSTA